MSVGGRPIGVLGRGSVFGEIAVLHGTPRTATVTSGVRLYALAKEPFLTAVAGHAPAHEAAHGLAAERLACARA